MPIFNFQVDRLYHVTEALTLHGDPGLMGEPFTVESGARLVYRGLVELGGTARHVFDLGEGRKGYSRDRSALEVSLRQDLDALMQA
ncbi:MAG: hypothetical protein VKP62_00440 [Candidatus Sericytochromatia bacterium]|nr:hypothetical protein [Candidatus Sericytochromatia bacterium]